MFKRTLIFVFVTALISGCNLPLPNAEQPAPTPLGESQVTVTQIPASETPTQPTVSTNDKCGNPYYPIVDGGSWTYSINAQDNASSAATHSMAVVDDGSFTLTVQDDKSTFTLDGTCGDDGVILMNVPGISASYSGDGSSTLSTTNDDGVTVPDEILVGDDWSQTIGVVGSSNGRVTISATIETSYKALGYETVTVPAGTFYALKVEQNGSMSMNGTAAFETHGYIWYAPEIGTVKSSLDGTYSSELVSYNIP